MVKVKKLHPEAVIPKYAHKGDAGMDIYSVEELIIPLKERRLIKTGLSFEIPEGYEIQVRPKSGLALNHGLTILNTPGTIDSGYRGEICVILFNTSDKDYQVKKGEKIAQIVLKKVELMDIEEVNELSDSSRGQGGFGSTGVK
mgnify:FL=1